MAKILGLDLGTNSIGWAVVDTEKLKSSDFIEKNESIIACGSRVFKEGVNMSSSGKEESKNLQRRNARGARRRNNRFKQRRKKLLQELLRLGMLPDNTHYTFQSNDSKNHTIELFRLRKDALEKQIRLEDIGRILLQINNHRGFKSNKKEDAVVKADYEKQKEQKGVKGRISKLEERINECNCTTIGEYYYYLIEQNKNSHNPNEPKLLNNDDIFRGEGAYTSRELFSKEFDAVWAKQSQYYPELLTDENKSIIKDECIFFQRDLRSAKHLRNRCKLEYKGYRWDKNGKKQLNYLPCCPKSSFEFQEYRIWEQLNKIRYTNYDVTFQSLNEHQKKDIARELHLVEKLSLTEIKKIAGLDRSTKFNDIGTELKGNVTQARLIKVLKHKWIEYAQKDDAINEDNSKENFETIKYSKIQKMFWHNIEFAKDKEWLLGDTDFLDRKHNRNRRYAEERKRDYQSYNNWETHLKNLGLSENQIQEYSELTFEPGYSDLSLRAIKKMLPYMKQGDDPITASCKVYGDYASTIQKQNIKLEKFIPQLENNALKNPIVEKAVRETIKVVNTIIDKFGKPDEIHVEMARELKMPKEHRENRKKRNDDKNKIREEYAKFLNKTLSSAS